METDIICEWQMEATLGEGPLWAKQENAIYWVDIVQKKLHRLALSNKSKATWELDEQITSLVCKKSGGFLGTTRDGFVFIDLNLKKTTPISLPEVDIPGNRFNDGKLDIYGRFWAGSMDESEKAPSGCLYRLDPDMSVHKMDVGYTITNGPAFNPDYTVMYHNDTSKRVVYAYDVNEKGELDNKRIFYELKGKNEGYPDGMTVDSEGCLWLCHFGGGRISKIAPSGEVIRIIPMPVPNITSCTFGGLNLDTLYITTARHLLSEETINKYPLAGSLFSFRPGVKGLPTPLFDDTKVKINEYH